MANKKMIDLGDFLRRATDFIGVVEETASAVVITRDGRPVVEIKPIVSGPTALLRSVHVADGVDLTSAVVEGADWEGTA